MANMTREERYEYNKQKREHYHKDRGGTQMTENNGMHTDLIDHEIAIDDYIKVTLSIPKQLTAIELKGIMIKANQLLKMSEVTVLAGGIPSRHYKPRRANVEWKEGLVEQLVNAIEARDRDISKTKIFRTFAEKHKLTEKDVTKRYYYLKGHNLLPAESGSKNRRII